MKWVNLLTTDDFLAIFSEFAEIAGFRLINNIVINIPIAHMHIGHTLKIYNYCCHFIFLPAEQYNYSQSVDCFHWTLPVLPDHKTRCPSVQS